MSASGASGDGRPGCDAARAGCVIGLLGPTAVGKTAVAAALARSLGVRVISCDSMQVYRGFPVLTNQPSSRGDARRGARAGRLRRPDRPASPRRSTRPAPGPSSPRTSDELGVGRLAGGTGLYLRAALAPLAVAPGDPEVRARLEARAAAEGAGALHAELARLDPEAAAAVDPRNARRVVRALEAVLASAGRHGRVGTTCGTRATTAPRWWWG